LNNLKRNKIMASTWIGGEPNIVVKQEPYNFLPGFVEQFDPKQGEIDGEEWTAVHLLKWLELNKFKIIK